jgi:hypothetical protein
MCSFSCVYRGQAQQFISGCMAATVFLSSGDLLQRRFAIRVVRDDAVASEPYSIWISCVRVVSASPTPEGKCFGGLYRSFRFVLALIQFYASHLARRSRKVQRSPVRNNPYRCESCSQTRMVGYRCGGKREREVPSVLMLEPWCIVN